MFGFLKDKLKSAISRISKKVEEEAPKEEIKEVEVKEKPKHEVKEQKKAETKKDSKNFKSKTEKKKVEEPDIEEQKTEEKLEEVIEKKDEKKGFFSKLKEKFTEKPKEEFKEVEVKQRQEYLEVKEEKKGFFGSIKEKIVTTKISAEKFEDLFSDLEIVLLENNVAFEVVEKIKEDLKKDLIDKPIKRGQVEEEIAKGLKESIEDLFLVPKINLIDMIHNKKEKPFVICFVGINGSGKTTSIAKVANLLKNKGLSVVLSASDTFRAAAIQQLKEWGSRLNVKVIAHDYGSDPAAVAFDSINFAKAHKIDVVLVDTAGRLHSNKDLLREMEKIVRISKPDLKLFIGEAITGSDCIEQAREFNSSIGIDGIILSKADIDEKGGATISISYVVHRPIVYIGIGQELGDLKEFDNGEIIKQLGL